MAQNRRDVTFIKIKQKKIFVNLGYGVVNREEDPH